MKLSEVPNIDKPITMIFKHSPEDVQIDLPNVELIDCFMTEAWANSLSAEAWEQIKKMPGFIKPFRMVFPDVNLDVAHKLSQHGAGVRHVAGLIVLTYKALLAGKRPYWRYPEAHLHPAAQLGLGDLLIYLMNLSTGKKDGQPDATTK